jgi:hypothetical protein
MLIESAGNMRNVENRSTKGTRAFKGYSGKMRNIEKISRRTTGILFGGGRRGI